MKGRSGPLLQSDVFAESRLGASIVGNVMKISHFCLLGAMLLVPQLTQAQSANPTQTGSVDAARSGTHGSTAWARERLDEMDATLALLEKKLADSKSENRAAAERAVADMREQREALKQVVEAKRQANEAEWQQTKATVESRWTAFEAAVQKWADATRQDVADQNELFVARADAQLKAWKEAIDQLDASAKASASDRKREIESAMAAIRADREVVKARLEALKRSGKETRIALANALDESRAAFDRANQAAAEAFKRALN
jgi:membrane protein involved in colicin uptake